MLDFATTLTLAARMPSLFSGATLHRAALHAAFRCRFEVADRLFERAAERYRQGLAVEPLARLRVHQMITRVRSGTSPERESALCLDIEHRLARLSHLESLEPPFELMNARLLQAIWMHAPASRRANEPLQVDDRHAA